MASPPIADGAVLVGADGRLLAAGPHSAVPLPHGAIAEVVPGAALIPGLVNTHTHLELTGSPAFDDAIGFPEWITALRRWKATRSPAEYLEAARQGISDCWQAGVTTVADTGDTGAVIQALHEAGGSGICYHEVFGPDPAQCEGSLVALRARLAELERWTAARIRLGVSPHAPYSVSGALYTAVAREARDQGRALAVHLAESVAESALVGRGEGPFAAQWRARGIATPARGCSPVAHLDACEVLGPDTLAIHLVQASADDLATLARRGTAVAHCPLSNRRHEHGEAPLRAMLTAGLRVGVGTDSVASVGRLDLLAEARAARLLAWLDAEEALALVTRDAARALGLEGEVGTLVPGAWGDVAAVRLPGPAPADVYEAVLAAGAGDILGTWLAGREVFRRPGSSD